MRAFRVTCILGFVSLVLVLCPTTSEAEGLLTPFIGSSFAGDSDGGRTTFGVSLASTANGIFGFEFDFGTTRNVFGDTDVVGDSSVTTSMGNVLVGVPAGFLRPYAVAGVGLIRSVLEGPSNIIGHDSNDFGVNVGVGLIVFFSDHMGVRGDVRWFRANSGDADERLLDFNLDLGDVDFWRGTGGLTLRW